MRRIAVIGGGAMGSGIAHSLLAAGDSVSLFEISDAAWQRACERIEKSLKKKGLESRLSNMKRLHSLEDAASCDAAIEAAPEKLELKRSIFKELDRILPPPKVLATNTSSLKIISISQVCAHPERVIGMHFFNPVPVMKFMEIIPSEKTLPGVLQFAMETAQHLGKETVVVKDSPGFVANRVLMPFCLEAVELLETRGVPAAGIDEAVRRLGGFPMGPFELMDFIGLDVCLEINRILYQGLGQPERFHSHAMLEEMAAKGYLGRKTGKGFYEYGKEAAPGAQTVENEDEIFLLILSTVIHESFLLVEEGVAEAADVDKTLVLGGHWKKGPFEFFKELGPKRVLAALEGEARRHPKRYEPISATLRFQSGLLANDPEPV